VSAEPTHTAWRTANVEWLLLRLERLRLRLQRRALWVYQKGAVDGGVHTADWLVSADVNDTQRRFHEVNADSKTIQSMIETLEKRLEDHEERMRTTSRRPALRLLTDLAGLSPFEEELLLLAAAPAIDGTFGRAYAELQNDARHVYATLHLALGVCLRSGTERVLAADCLMPARPLRSLRLIEVDDDSHEPLLTRRIGVDERLADYLRGVNRADSRIAPLLSDGGSALQSEATERQAELLAKIVAAEADRWITVNLVGSVEGGAREVAESACARLGMHLRTLDIRQLAAVEPDRRDLLIALLGREALLGGLAYLVDTARTDREGGDAVTISQVTARISATLFVVSAERWPASRDVRVLTIARPTRGEQRTLWRTALAAHQYSVNGEIDAIVQQFDFGPPAIAAAIAGAVEVSGIELTGADLWRACREQSGVQLDDLARRILPSYGWSDIVVSEDVQSQLRELASQVELRGRVYEEWGFGARLSRGRGISALFSGASGTGKTMAAEILAGHLALDLYRIDLAGVVSKYVGETEKNLRRVFAAAERSGAILLFDEADALFGTRTEVRDSHDRYANIEVNYLLQWMEDYAGLAILATNRRDALDHAFLRRLRFVVDFAFPGVDDRRRIWERVFPPQTSLRDIEYSYLARLELTGGNIRSIAVNAAFLAASDSAPIEMRHLVRAAAREYTKLSRPISAAEFGAYHALARA
jgi:hypothetical protein